MLTQEMLTILETDRNWIKGTCVPGTVESLKKYSKTFNNNGELELIQLSKAYCNFDGWDERCLHQFGFVLIFAEIPVRRVNDPYNGSYSNEDGMNITQGIANTLGEHIHQPMITKRTLADKYKAIVNDIHFRPLFWPKVEKRADGSYYWPPIKGLKTPLILRKLIMMHKYAENKLDYYQWHKTEAMQDSSCKKVEVKTILTHVNGIELYEVFNLPEHVALKHRVIKYSSLISTEGACNIETAEVRTKSAVRCAMQ